LPFARVAAPSARASAPRCWSKLPGLCRSVSATSSAFASLAGWHLPAVIIPTALAGSNAMSEKGQ
ncbi:hypothetical protein, partial [Thermogemmatispora sp.]|uniref:hypothetical protein n=1 Tax=Thermogemmatispora sp. TaxID=1968838 RepID=UPI00257CD33A